MPIRNPQWSISAMAKSIAASRAYSDQTKTPLNFEQIQKSGFTPHTRVMAHIKPTPRILPGREPYGRATSTKAKYATKGRTNGMPWDGTSPINESTLVEIGKSRPVAPRNLESRLAHMWRSYAPNELVIELLGLSNEIRPYSSEIADDVAWLASVAWERAK